MVSHVLICHQREVHIVHCFCLLVLQDCIVSLAVHAPPAACCMSLVLQSWERTQVDCAPSTGGDVVRMAIERMYGCSGGDLHLHSHVQMQT